MVLLCGQHWLHAGPPQPGQESQAATALTLMYMTCG